MCQMSSKPCPDSMIYWEDSQDSTYSCTPSYDFFFYNRKIQSKINKENVKSRAKQVQASKGSLPVESHRIHLILPAMSCVWQHTWHVVYQGSSLETQCPRFLFGVEHLSTLCLTHKKTPDSQKESSNRAYTTLCIQTV